MILENFLLDGGTVNADIKEAITSADSELTIDGASVVNITVRDDRRILLRSEVFGQRTTMQLMGRSFELVSVNKTGSDLRLTFEDLEVALLRRANAPKKVEPGMLSRVRFIQQMVDEIPGCGVWSPVDSEETKVEMMRGKLGDENNPPELEGTWEAAGRLMADIGWRRFMREGKVWLVYDEWLFNAGRDVLWIWKEHEAGIHDINFDYDSGKPVGSASVTVEADTASNLQPGQVVDLQNMGIGSGGWLIKTIRRNLFSVLATVDLYKPQPVIGEPDPPPAPSSAELGPEGATSTGSASSSVSTPSPSTTTQSPGVYTWPVSGPVVSGYGQRSGRLHAGIDIAVKVGTPVVATRAGVVTFAGLAGGYGNVIYLRHDNGVFSRYAHLSRFSVHRGMEVRQGQIIGNSGGAKGAPGAGNSTGPHLHFEIRPGDSPADPQKFLNDRRGVVGNEIVVKYF